MNFEVYFIVHQNYLQPMMVSYQTYHIRKYELKKTLTTILIFINVFIDLNKILTSKDNCIGRGDI